MLKESAKAKKMRTKKVPHHYSIHNLILAVTRIFEIASTVGWAGLLTKYKQLSTAWEQPCNSSILVAGLPGTGKSTVLSLIENVKSYEPIEQISSFDKFKILRCKLQGFDRYASSYSN